MKEKNSALCILIFDFFHNVTILTQLGFIIIMVHRMLNDTVLKFVLQD